MVQWHRGIGLFPSVAKLSVVSVPRLPVLRLHLSNLWFHSQTKPTESTVMSDIVDAYGSHPRYRAHQGRQRLNLTVRPPLIRRHLQAEQPRYPSRLTRVNRPQAAIAPPNVTSGHMASITVISCTDGDEQQPPKVKLSTPQKSPHKGRLSGVPTAGLMGHQWGHRLDAVHHAISMPPLPTWRTCTALNWRS